jgi:hypothetical protein
MCWLSRPRRRAVVSLRGAPAAHDVHAVVAVPIVTPHSMTDVPVSRVFRMEEFAGLPAPGAASSQDAATVKQTALAQLLAADLPGLDLVAVLIDGVHFGEHTCMVALGHRPPLGKGHRDRRRS